LEIVQDLSTEAFLHALRRFAARHGWPTTISSDNGTSFIGAESELRKLMKEGRREIEDFAVTHKIKWRFNTPLSPHQGGMFERMVKQTKTALKVIVGQHILSWNEMSTVFAEVECLVNSRPLGYPSNDANDLQPLTPNRFILGRATADIPQGPFREAKAYRKRFEFVQSLVQQFWSRFQ
jgi:transposase InsO family protein